MLSYVNYQSHQITMVFHRFSIGCSPPTPIGSAPPRPSAARAAAAALAPGRPRRWPWQRRRGLHPGPETVGVHGMRETRHG